MPKHQNILVIGSSGQVGTELLLQLRNNYAPEYVIASDLKNSNAYSDHDNYEQLDVLDKKRLFDVIKKHDVGTVYHLAAFLSASAEKNPELAWDLNMNGLLNVLNLAKEKHIKKIFWPSTIAVFGHNTPKKMTPQHTIMEPATIYGISKLAGERWCEYFHHKFGVDVRSVRYPGLIGFRSKPGGGTTDYAVDIFHEAMENGKYTCFLDKKTTLPMMYMPDAIRASIEITEIPSHNIKIRSSYNLSAMSFSPEELEHEIVKYIPDFECNYLPDFRQELAEGWPQSIDDSSARADWHWKAEYDLRKMTVDMIQNLQMIKAGV
jgi:nucleoside-diphosphate-sugar epimerase